MSGRIVSASTHKPIPGACVALHDAPQLRSATTDSTGHFSLSDSRNFHFFYIYGICGGEQSILSPLSHDIDVSHSGYASQQINPWEHSAKESSGASTSIELKDILLRPKNQ